MRDPVSPMIRAAVNEESKHILASGVSAVLFLSAFFQLLAIPANRDLGPEIWSQLLVARLGGAALQVAIGSFCGRSETPPTGGWWCLPSPGSARASSSPPGLRR